MKIKLLHFTKNSVMFVSQYEIKKNVTFVAVLNLKHECDIFS